MVVVLEFSRTFKEGRVRVRLLKFKAIEESISQATGLPLTGERWFKKEWLGKKQRHWFMVDKNIKVD